MCMPGTCESQKVSVPLELELWMGMSHHMGLVAEPGSSARAISALQPCPQLLLLALLPPTHHRERMSQKVLEASACSDVQGHDILPVQIMAISP